MNSNDKTNLNIAERIKELLSNYCYCHDANPSYCGFYLTKNKCEKCTSYCCDYSLINDACDNEIKQILISYYKKVYNEAIYDAVEIIDKAIDEYITEDIGFGYEPTLEILKRIKMLNSNICEKGKDMTKPCYENCNHRENFICTKGAGNED